MAWRRTRVIAAEILARAFYLPVVFLRDPVAFLRHAVPLLGDLVALLGLLVALGGHLGPHQGRRVPVERALDALGARELMRSHHLRIAGRSASEITIRRGLVSLRGALVGVSLDLVAVGRALIGVRGGLVPVGAWSDRRWRPPDRRVAFFDPNASGYALPFLSPRATRAAPEK